MNKRLFYLLIRRNCRIRLEEDSFVDEVQRVNTQQLLETPGLHNWRAIEKLGEALEDDVDNLVHELISQIQD